MYADYVFYRQEYRGTAIDEASFPGLAVRASAVIDQVTFGRSADTLSASETALVGRATCAVADELQQIDVAGGPVQSETVGRHSVTYAVQPVHSRLLAAIYRYLGNTGLTYRGLDES